MGAERGGSSWCASDLPFWDPGQEGLCGHRRSKHPALTPQECPKGPHTGSLTSNPFLLTLFILMMKHGFPSSKPKLGSTRPEQLCSMSLVNLQENLVWLGALKLSWMKSFSEVQFMLSCWASGE